MRAPPPRTSPRARREAEDAMSGLLEDLSDVVKLLVDEPEAVQVEELEGGDSIRFELQVAPDDLGKVIGRQGRTVRALRNLLDARGERDGERYRLQILDD